MKSFFAPVHGLIVLPVCVCRPFSVSVMLAIWIIPDSLIYIVFICLTTGPVGLRYR